MASITSFSRVSGAGPPEASPNARRTGSLDNCSTSSPSGAITRAAVRGTLGMEVCRAARTKPKITSKRIRCRTLRIPSSRRHTSPKNPKRAAPVVIQRLGLSRNAWGLSRSALELLVDACRLARQIPQVVQLGAPHGAVALHADFADRRTESLKNPLHAFTVRNFAHCERGIEAAIFFGDNHAFIGLNALAITLHHFDLDDDGIAGVEIRQLTRCAFAVQFLDDFVHNSRPLARSILNSSNNARSSSLMPRRSSSSGRRNQVRPSACRKRQRRIAA